MSPCRLFLHHRHTRAVELYIESRNRLANHHWQLQLKGLGHGGLLALGDIGTDGLGRSLHGFGRDLQVRQNLHLFALVIERGFLAYHLLHAAHAGRELRVLNVQFSICEKLARMVGQAYEVGTRYLPRGPRPSAPAWSAACAVSPFAIGTRKIAFGGGGHRELYQFPMPAPSRCKAERIAISTASRSRPWP
jgi:hypothetical protein